MPTPDFLCSLPLPATPPEGGAARRGHAPTDLDLALLEVVIDTRLSHERAQQTRLRQGVRAVAVAATVVIGLGGAAVALA